jgi:hypothetical protein
MLATREEIVQAVNAYNALYREMDEALWCVSRSVRDSLLRGQACQGLEVLVWTVKTWWGVQGVKTETKSIAARALAALGWTDAMFGEEPIDDRAEFALDRVSALVGRMKNLGANRTEFSLAAKSLHWLMPWRIPVYDSFVRRSLGISTGASPQSAYLDIVQWEFEIADSLMDGDSDWLGTVNPRSPLRALDKYLWCKGGGHTGKAVQVRDPWSICRSLGLNCR